MIYFHLAITSARVRGCNLHLLQENLTSFVWDSEQPMSVTVKLWLWTQKVFLLQVQVLESLTPLRVQH